LDQSERQRDLSEPEKELRLTLARDLLAVARELQSSTPAPAGAEQISGAISQ
jgi:inorganic triphosphatase YgiF